LPRPPSKTPSNQRFGGVFVCPAQAVKSAHAHRFLGKFWACKCRARDAKSRVAHAAEIISDGRRCASVSREQGRSRSRAGGVQTLLTHHGRRLPASMHCHAAGRLHGMDDKLAVARHAVPVQHAPAPIRTTACPRPSLKLTRLTLKHSERNSRRKRAIRWNRKIRCFQFEPESYLTKARPPCPSDILRIGKLNGLIGDFSLREPKQAWEHFRRAYLTGHDPAGQDRYRADEHDAHGPPGKRVDHQAIEPVQIAILSSSSSSSPKNALPLAIVQLPSFPRTTRSIYACSSNPEASPWDQQECDEIE